jgi:hypothetical protein
MPMWIDNPDRPDEAPYRPVGAVWVSLGSGLVNIGLGEEGSPAFS